MTEIKKDITLELDITDINNLGNGVGRVDGRVVFVPGAVSGDRVRAKVIKVNKSFAVARLTEVLISSPNRCAEEICTAPLSCGGCVYRHITYEHEAELKRGYVKAAFAKVGLGEANVLPVLCTGRITGYRNKAQYPVAKNKNGIYAGFYASKTHNVLPAEDCAIQNVEFSPIVKAVCEFAQTNGWSVYDEESGKGLLRHIYLRIGEKTGQIMLCLVLNADSLPNESGFVESIRAAFPRIASIMLNKNAESTNVVLGKSYRTLWGKSGIEDELCSLRFFISPDSFYQVNRDAAELLYTKAAEMAELSGEEVLMDLYCGTGTIGLSMANRVKTLCGVEIVSAAVECAKENAERNGIKNARFICADAGDRQTILDAAGGVRPDAIIMDPPRKGSTKELVDCISELGVPKVVYISCDPDTLARDCAWFVENGYIMSDVQPVDLFPRTGHVENVVCLTKKINYVIN
jgi:23S rRNA (uracil1939-C5)-methyltransferase